MTVGGAQVSELHCNFLINLGSATAADIETLGETVRRRVKENSGVELEWEIKRIGVAVAPSRRSPIQGDCVDSRGATADDPSSIVGGGLGGAHDRACAGAARASACACSNSAPEFGAIGYGIQLGPNVFHVFDRLGVSDAVLREADRRRRVLMVDASTARRSCAFRPGASFRARFKQPYIVIHRVDLHHVLLDACRAMPAIELGADAMVSGFEDRGDRVAVDDRGRPHASKARR